MDQDTVLIERVCRGESSAFREIVDKHKKNVYYLAYDLTHNKEDAEDISQEVFVKAFRSIDKFRGDAKLSSWLYRITVNTYLSLKKRKSYAAMKTSENIDNLIETKAEDNNPGSSVSPERKTEAGFIKKHIDKALQKLSDRERTIFIMRNVNEMSFDEIVEVLKIQPSTVRSANFKALKKLRNELAFYKNDI